MVKVATKPKALVTVETESEEEVGHSDDTLVTDHGIDGLTLHHDFDGTNQTLNGILDMAAGQIAFEATFNTSEAWSDKTKVREALIAGAVYTDEARKGQSVAGHVAMNRSFKQLLAWTMNSLNEQEAQTS